MNKLQELYQKRATFLELGSEVPAVSTDGAIPLPMPAGPQRILPAQPFLSVPQDPAERKAILSQE